MIPWGLPHGISRRISTRNHGIKYINMERYFMKKLLTISLLAFLGIAYVGTIYAVPEHSTSSTEHKKTLNLKKTLNECKLDFAKLNVGKLKKGLCERLKLENGGIEIKVGEEVVKDDIILTEKQLETAVAVYTH